MARGEPRGSGERGGSGALRPAPPPERLERVLIAADFHLDGGEPGRDRLAALLELARAESAPLFILGDLFHYWFGRRHLELPMYAQEIALLADAVRSGVRAYVWPGNRDFLLDSVFSEATGIWVGGDETTVHLGRERVSVSHGDLFATADLHYQAMRQLVRSAPIRLLARHLPTRWVDRIAARLRRHSQRVVREKPAATLEPDRAAVLATLRAGADTVICGHFHQFHDERFPAELGGGRFLVLEPFEARGAYLRGSEDGWSLGHVTSPGRRALGGGAS
ncbi:MAG: metallophosphoesterase [Planctomycetes bacterium]|nr:metallophosphoesterase [Planctomycetota bacterium]